MKRLQLQGVFALLFISFYSFSEPGPYFRFIENKNQWHTDIDFKTRIPGGTMSVQAGRFTYTLLDYQKIEEYHHQRHYAFEEVKKTHRPPEMINGHAVSVEFIGANSLARPEPFGKLSMYYNFFTGSDPAHWGSDAKAFEGMFYRSLYAGIDLKVYSTGNHLKYDFIVAPGADPAQISAAYSGAEQLFIDRGDLFIKTSLGDLIEKKPVAYQMIDGQRTVVSCEFVLNDAQQLSFRFPQGYDTCYELTIDPLLIFSTYSGSQADNWGSTATPGENGTLYSSGVTNQYVDMLVGGIVRPVFSGKFPATAGAFQTNYGGIYDVGILKYDSTGQHLLYASYLGGADNESAHSLVMNANKELIVLGTTGSSNFPVTVGAIDGVYNDGNTEYNVIPYENGSDIFVARISQDGRKLLASTYLGGSDNDGLNPYHSTLSKNYGDELRGDVITDNQGNIYVSTVTASHDFPVVNSFNTQFKGGETDALVLKLNESLTSIVWAAFVGGSGADASHTIKLDKAGNLYVAGGTSSSNFPTTAQVYQPAIAGKVNDVDGWIAKIAADGSSLLAATYTGSPVFNQVYFLDLNQQDEVYVYGQTAGTFPVTSGTYHNSNSGQFIQKFNKELNKLIFSTVFGSGRGLPDISPTAFLVNNCNNIFMTGWGGEVNSITNYWQTNTYGMPVTPDAYQKTTHGSDFYFMVLTADASELLYATYMGGVSSATHVDGGTSRFDKNGIVYHAVCAGCEQFSDFPTTPNAWSRKNNSLNCNNAAFKFDLSSLRARIQTNSVKLNMPGLSKVCIPDKIVFQNRSTGGEIYQWDFGDGKKTEVYDTAAITHQYKNTGKYTVKMKAIDAGTCIGKDSVATVVNVYKALGVAGPGGTYCTGSSFQLQASGGVAYEWVALKSTFKSQAQNLSVSPTVETDYQITITDFQGCVMKDTVNVKVVPGIDLQMEWQTDYSCGERPVLKVKNLTDASEDTFWDFGDGNTSDQQEVTHAYQKDDLYFVRLVGKKEYCVYDKKIQFPAFTFFIPNVITPDQSPGKNDTFQLYYGNRTPVEMNTVVSLTIVNRWGEKVYEDKNYQNTWNGDNLAPGIYFYEATLQGQTTCRGWVQIMR